MYRQRFRIKYCVVPGMPMSSKSHATDLTNLRGHRKALNNSVKKDSFDVPLRARRGLIGEWLSEFLHYLLYS